MSVSYHHHINKIVNTLQQLTAVELVKPCAKVVADILVVAAAVVPVAADEVFITAIT